MEPQAYKSMNAELQNMSQAKKPTHPAITVLKGVGGAALGATVGHGAVLAVNALTKKYMGRPVIDGAVARSVLPMIGGLAPLLMTASSQAMAHRAVTDYRARKALKEQRGR